MSAHYSTGLGTAYLGDSLEVLKGIAADSVDLVITSPPFALLRKKEYGNRAAEEYADWILPFCREIHRILKSTGSFVLEIGGAWTPGMPTRSLYHFDLAVRLAQEGWHLCQDFYHFNPAALPAPAEWTNVRRVRVKAAVNLAWWFGKSPNPKADNRKVLQPYSESMKSLLEKGYKAKKRPSGHDISDKFAKDNGGAIPPNLLSFANTESNSAYLRRCKEAGLKPHPARFPSAFVDFFLDFLTDPGDLVVDPFAGSNTTGAACEAKGRRWIACEQVPSYLEGSRFRFRDPLTIGGAA